jgi:glycosyltransferase involved in cell wall biosynthesis
MEDRQKPSLVYIAMCSRKEAPGVVSKVNGVVRGARSCGYNGRAQIIEPGPVGRYLRFVYEIATAKEEVVFVRYINRVGVLVFVAGLILRMRSRDLYIDVPTPLQNHLREVFTHEKQTWINVLDGCLMMVQGVLPFLSATKVIQYAEESWWFSIGVRKKTIKTGNGIDVSSVPVRESAPMVTGKRLNLVAVGTIASWHGWDRVIKAIAKLRSSGGVMCDVTFKIIGEGPESGRLKQLASSCGVADNVLFPGLLYGEELYNEYRSAHYGIGSLGWSRIGVSEASPLKVREYLAAGMPVISATKDPDFVGDESFVLSVTSDEDIDSLVDILKKVCFMPIASPQECRRFAEEKLDYSIKMRAILPVLQDPGVTLPHRP